MRKKLMGAICIMTLVPTIVLSPAPRAFAAENEVRVEARSDDRQGTLQYLMNKFKNMDFWNIFHINLGELEKVIVQTMDRVNVNLKDVDINVAIDLIKVTININHNN